MENASKALIMVASILIGIMVLSLAVYLFATFGSSSAEMYKQIETDRLNQFNTQFTSYEGRDDLTIYDVVTVANLAKENNTYYELTNSDNSNFYVIVKLGSTKIESNSEQQNQILFGNYDASNEYNRFTCNVTISSDTNRVKKIEFKKRS